MIHVFRPGGLHLGVLVGVLGGCALTPPPAPVEAPQAPSLVVEADRVVEDVETLSSDAFLGRGAGTTGGALAVGYVEERFRETGLEPAYTDGFRQPVALPTGGEGANVVGQILGTVHPRSVILVTAHLDGLGTRAGQVFNGADDNASGVAALLAVAERLRAHPPEHTVVFAALDAEEIGLVGAEALAADPPVPLGAVLAVVNLDMVARGPLWAAGTAHYPHLGPLVAEAAPTVRFGHDTGAGPDNWTGASDHAAFHRRGVPFVYLGVEDHPDYHQPTDDADRIETGTLARNADAIARIVEALDGAHAALVAGR